ncbi:MAG: alpha-glucan family phosphorylase, partial [Alistipes sp.]|nr:alpha-glucan family phosphorylase [Candidatus Minthomonas equi]
MAEITSLPDYLFEVSWEVCNKIGGIHTVLATKAKYLSENLKNRHILIGPDIWMDTKNNPEFEEDGILFRSWRLYAAQNGLRIRVGRWNVPGKPVTILVDFSQFIPKKNEIMTQFWNDFQLDSLTGQWDFVEPALFGYAAGMVIESFLQFNIDRTKKVVAQFHKWMTGAGILYLKQKKLPVATVFTTHATVVGRCLASNGVPLYSEMADINGDDKARWFNIMAMHSLEQRSAENADVFTAVSSITASECAQILRRKPDLLTPNGYDSSMVPENSKSMAAQGREILVSLAEKMTGIRYENPFIIGISGRNEMKTKGIDAFIDSLGQIKASAYDGRTILAFIMTPSVNNGPVREFSGSNVTHSVSDSGSDRILKALAAAGIDNSAEDRVKAFLVPANLDGTDGVFNKTYLELLSGMDLTVFPSYYEPWGFTPLESVAMGVPTITTTLTGYGMWVSENYDMGHPSVTVIPRNDDNYEEVVEKVAGRIMEMSSLVKEEMAALKNNAAKVAKVALWNNIIVYYKKAYELSLKRIGEKNYTYSYLQEDAADDEKESSKPNWKSVTVSRILPERLQALDIISKNLWWCWNQEAIELFESIDYEKWLSVHKNPIALLDLLTLNDYRRLEKDASFLARLDAVAASFASYMEEKKHRTNPSIAYFSMEYGLDPSLKIYSGGLGILAGDYLKESSDMNVNMTGIGLLYRYGYFNQKLTAQGEQVSDYVPQDFMKIPAVAVRDAEGKWVTISVAMPGRNVYARLWRVDVGRTELYLMDTDFDANLPEDRQITYNLYGGDWENRLKQEILLGVGGIRALRALNIKADIYHCNEGHAAFTGLERIREYVNGDNLSFAEAMEIVRSSSLFTTHTPVPAGHDAFDEDLLRIYMSHIPDKMKTNWTTFMGLGRVNANDHNEKFSMSYLASNISQEINGVSWLHGKVSQDILAPLWPGYLPEELHVGYVTNGVHYATWTAPEWKTVHAKVYGEDFHTHHYDKKCFEGIYEVEDSEIWKIRTKLRKRLIEQVRKR